MQDPSIMSELLKDSNGDVILCPVFEYLSGTADTGVFLVMKYGQLGQQGKPEARQVQFFLTAEQCLHLSERLRMLATGKRVAGECN